MGTSKCDFAIAGYEGRQKVHHNMKRTKSKYDARYMLKNPATKKVYTNAQMLADLAQRKKEYSPVAAGCPLSGNTVRRRRSDATRHVW